MSRKNAWKKLVERDSEVLFIYQVVEGRKFYPETICIDFKPKRTRYRNKWFLLWKEDMLQEYLGVKKKYKQDPKFLTNLVKKTFTLGERLLKTTSLVNSSLRNKSNEKLTDSFWKFHILLENFVPLVFITFTVEKLLSQKINDYLKKAFPNLTEEQRNKYFTILTAPKKETSPAKEFRALLRTASAYEKAGKLTPSIERETKEIHKKYHWLGAVRIGWSYLRNSYSLNHYKYMAKKLSKEDPQKKLREITNQALRQKKEYRKIKKMKEIKSGVIKEATLLQEYLYQKTLRGEYIVRALLLVKPLLREIANRLSVKFEDLVYFTPEEVTASLRGEDLPNFQPRKRGFDILMEGDQLILKLREPRTKKIVREKQALKGTPAQLGRIRGKVKIILDSKASRKMKKGDILVTKMTSPDFLIALHRAAAIITDEGGITCHAAIVSREFGIPCVVGTKIATQVLKDGDLVEVNAEKGVVKKLTKPEGE